MYDETILRHIHVDDNDDIIFLADKYSKKLDKILSKTEFDDKFKEKTKV